MIIWREATFRILITIIYNVTLVPVHSYPSLTSYIVHMQQVPQGAVTIISEKSNLERFLGAQKYS